MRLSTLAVGAFASSAVALPSLGSLFSSRDQTCITRNEAKDIVDVYARLIANYTASDCEKYCAEDFADWSDSINKFIFKPLGEPTFGTKQIFMDAQASNPSFPLVVDGIDAVDCDAIALRWHATFGAVTEPSRGITILRVTKTAGWWQIKTIYVEFDALEWLLAMKVLHIFTTSLLLTCYRGGNYTWEG